MRERRKLLCFKRMTYVRTASVLRAPRKMYSLALLVVCGLTAWSVQAAIVLDDGEVEKSWMAFKQEFNKKYSTKDEPHRRIIFEGHLQEVIKHNMAFMRGESSFEIQIIESHDLTSDEQQRQYDYHSFPEDSGAEEGSLNLTEMFRGLSQPESIDWRDEGIVSDLIRNQPAMKCGCCYVIAAVDTLQSLWTLKTQSKTPPKDRKVEVLSIQQPLDCCHRYRPGCHRCKGGTCHQILTTIKRDGGIASNAAYPVAEKQSDERKCKIDKKDFTSAKVRKVQRSYDERNTQEDGLKVVVGTIGPPAVTLCVGRCAKYKAYKSGIFDDETCPTDCRDHSFLVVGYKKDEYWIAKESQGIKFGENGFIRIKMGRSICGISHDVIWPSV